MATTSLLACRQLPEVPSLTQSALARLKTPLETRFSATALGPTDQIAGVIALGGSPARIREAARIASLYQGSKLIVTGASDEDYAAAQTGLKPDRLVRERHARNTFENALFSKRLANPRSGQRSILVTSGIQMPRAMGVFTALDFGVEPWPIFDGDGPQRASRPPFSTRSWDSPSIACLGAQKSYSRPHRTQRLGWVAERSPHKTHTRYRRSAGDGGHYFPTHQLFSCQFLNSSEKPSIGPITNFSGVPAD